MPTGIFQPWQIFARSNALPHGCASARCSAWDTTHLSNVDCHMDRLMCHEQGQFQVANLTPFKRQVASESLRDAVIHVTV